MGGFVLYRRWKSVIILLSSSPSGTGKGTPKRNMIKRKGQVKTMKKYVCEPCGYVYDPEVGDPDGGIAPGTAFEDLPEDWVCPVCGMGKDVFVEE